MAVNLELVREPRKRLRLVLIIMAIHSFFIGIGLVIQLPMIMDLFGLGHIEQPFFPAQGGIFHVLMAVAYITAALRPEGNGTLINFIIVVKITATVFLFFYFTFIQNIWMILFSGICDGILALLILISYRSFKNLRTQNG